MAAILLVLLMAAVQPVDDSIIQDGTSLRSLGLAQPVEMEPGGEAIVIPAVFPDGVTQGAGGDWYGFAMTSSLIFPSEAEVGAKATLTLAVNGFAAVQVIYELTDGGVTASGIGWVEGDVLTTGGSREAALEYENFLQTNGVEPGPAQITLSLRSNDAGAGARATVDPTSHFTLSDRSPYAVTLELSSVKVDDGSATITFDVAHNRPDPLDEVEVFVRPLAGVSSVSAPDSIALDDGTGSGTVEVVLDSSVEAAEILVGVDGHGFNAPSEVVVLSRAPIETSPFAQWRWFLLGAALLACGSYLFLARRDKPMTTKQGS